MIFLETERLILKPPSHDELNDLYQLQKDPIVMRFIGSGPRTMDKVAEINEIAINHFNKHGFSMCPLYEKQSGQFVGQAGIIYLEGDDTQPDIEIGYRLHQRFWGYGYATEIARSLIQWGFTHLNVDRLFAVTDADNAPSQNVLKKIGMQLKGHEQAYGVDVLKFVIYKDSVLG